MRPQLAERVRFDGTPEIRQEISRIVPLYRGIEELQEGGESFQYGGPHLCAGGEFPTADGRGRFSVVELPSPGTPGDGFELSTRRGKQFNSMVQASKDSLTGAMREAVLISSADAKRLGIAQDDRVRVRSATGEFLGRAPPCPHCPRERPGPLARGQRPDRRRTAFR